jgi:hypothetical protein
MINIYQMEHRYKQQEENQSRVITEKNQKKKVKSKKISYDLFILLDSVVNHYRYLHMYNHQVVE